MNQDGVENFDQAKVHVWVKKQNGRHFPPEFI
jgi:hypothetical protein